MSKRGSFLPPPRPTVEWPMPDFSLADGSDYVMRKIVAQLNDLNERIQTVEDTIGLALEDTYE